MKFDKRNTVYTLNICVKSICFPNDRKVLKKKLCLVLSNEIFLELRVGQAVLNLGINFNFV